MRKKGCDRIVMKNETKNGLELWSGVDNESHGGQGVSLIMNEFASFRFLWMVKRVK